VANYGACLGANEFGSVIVSEADVWLTKKSALPARKDGPHKSKPKRDGFHLPGVSGYTEGLPGKTCECGFSAFSFSKTCPKCGRAL
jgi:hypothetical protein